MRYSKEILTEKQIWDTYNLTRDVETTFRCLKTDLDIRPVFHQKDAYIEPHIKLCTRPNTDLSAIYSALGFKERPFVRKSKVVTQLQK